MENWKRELTKITKNTVFDEPMSNHTTFKVGGPAECLVKASSGDEAAAVMRLCKSMGVECTVIGNGSNLLVGDKGIKGVVLQIADGLGMCMVNNAHKVIFAEAGVKLSRLASEAAKGSLSGLEFASGIPGTLGGAVYMNAGAYGGEIGGLITSVMYADSAGTLKTAGRKELMFGYRYSSFSDALKGSVILACFLSLEQGSSDEIYKKMKELNDRRREKQPLSYPSAGSTFKRPEGHFAGKLIQDAGLMGYTIGGAQVSELHAGFIINKGGATASDIRSLIEHVRGTVKDKFGVELEPEVKMIGEF